MLASSNLRSPTCVACLLLSERYVFCCYLAELQDSSTVNVMLASGHERFLRRFVSYLWESRLASISPEQKNLKHPFQQLESRVHRYFTAFFVAVVTQYKF